MAAEGQAPGWSLAQRLLHWITALFVLTGFCIGLVMIDVPVQQFFLKFTLFQVHKSLGLLVLLAVAARLFLRARRGRPPLEGLSRWQARAAGLGHGALYALLLVVPALGYFVASSGPVRIPTRFLGVITMPDFTGPNRALFDTLAPLHRAFAIALVALAAGHAAMAIVHQWQGVPLLRRMWRG